MRVAILASLAVFWFAAPANAAPSECSNGLDDDGDTTIDFPYDLDCDSAKDDSEQCEGAHCPACSNGQDDDGDGDVDWPADTSCFGPYDDSEVTDCSDGEPNDWDDFIDYPDDPGCYGPSDETETSAGLPCDDGLDQDGDGLPDMLDAGCSDPMDYFETDPNLPCDDGWDNNFNGLTDWPDEWGCQHGGQLSFSEDPDCDDDHDNDGDGKIDFGDDKGCRNMLARSTEDTQCNNGWDDDGDGYCDTGRSVCLDGSIPGDPECHMGYWNDESHKKPVSVGCGLGFELAPLMLALFVAWTYLRRRAAAAATALLFFAALAAFPMNADARTASNLGVVSWSHSFNDGLTAVAAPVDAAREETAWIKNPWARYLTLPIIAPVRLVTQLAGAVLVNGLAMSFWEFWTYDKAAGYGRGFPLHPSPPHVWVVKTSVLPKCDWPWAKEAPRCLER